MLVPKRIRGFAIMPYVGLNLLLALTLTLNKGNRSQKVAGVQPELPTLSMGSYLSLTWFSTDTSGYAMVVHGRPKTPKNTRFFGGDPAPRGRTAPIF